MGQDTTYGGLSFEEYTNGYGRDSGRKIGAAGLPFEFSVSGFLNHWLDLEETSASEFYAIHKLSDFEVDYSDFEKLISPPSRENGSYSLGDNLHIYLQSALPKSMKEHSWALRYSSQKEIDAIGAEIVEADISIFEQITKADPRTILAPYIKPAERVNAQNYPSEFLTKLLKTLRKANDLQGSLGGSFPFEEIEFFRKVDDFYQFLTKGTIPEKKMLSLLESTYDLTDSDINFISDALTEAETQGYPKDFFSKEIDKIIDQVKNQEQGEVLQLSDYELMNKFARIVDAPIECLYGLRPLTYSDKTRQISAICEKISSFAGEELANLAEEHFQSIEGIDIERLIEIKEESGVTGRKLLGYALSLIRLSEGMTQAELGDKADLRPQKVSSMEIHTRTSIKNSSTRAQKPSQIEAYLDGCNTDKKFRGIIERICKKYDIDTVKNLTDRIYKTDNVNEAVYLLTKLYETSLTAIDRKARKLDPDCITYVKIKNKKTQLKPKEVRLTLGILEVKAEHRQHFEGLINLTNLLEAETELGSALRIVRESYDLTTTDIKNRLGVTRQAVNNAEIKGCKASTAMNYLNACGATRDVRYMVAVTSEHAEFIPELLYEVVNRVSIDIMDTDNNLSARAIVADNMGISVKEFNSILSYETKPNKTEIRELCKLTRDNLANYLTDKDSTYLENSIDKTRTNKITKSGAYKERTIRHPSVNTKADHWRTLSGPTKMSKIT